MTDTKIIDVSEKQVSALQKMSQGRSFLGDGEKEKARASFESALEIYKEIGSVAGEQLAQMGLNTLHQPQTQELHTSPDSHLLALVQVQMEVINFMNRVIFSISANERKESVPDVLPGTVSSAIAQQMSALQKHAG